MKAKIEKERGDDFKAASQKLIYQGKILSDETKVADFYSDKTKFIVVMVAPVRERLYNCWNPVL